MTLGLQDVCKTYMVQSHHHCNEYLEILFDRNLKRYQQTSRPSCATRSWRSRLT